MFDVVSHTLRGTFRNIRSNRSEKVKKPYNDTEFFTAIVKVDTLSASGTLRCFRSGVPTEYSSDNGTNLKRANEELQRIAEYTQRIGGMMEGSTQVHGHRSSFTSNHLGCNNQNPMILKVPKEAGQDLLNDYNPRWTLDWKQGLWWLGNSRKAKFKPFSVTRSVPSLVGYELPVIPDPRTIPREGAKPPKNLRTIPREGAEPPENLKTIPREGAKPSEMQAGVQASDDCKAAFSNSKCPIFDGVGSSATGGEHTHVLKAEPSNKFKNASKETPFQQEVECFTCPLPQKS